MRTWNVTDRDGVLRGEFSLDGRDHRFAFRHGDGNRFHVDRREVGGLAYESVPDLDMRVRREVIRSAQTVLAGEAGAARRQGGPSRPALGTVEVPGDLMERLAAIADTCGREPSWVVERALRAYLDGEGARVLAVRKGREQVAAGDVHDMDEVLREMEGDVAVTGRGNACPGGMNAGDDVRTLYPEGDSYVGGQGAAPIGGWGYRARPEDGRGTRSGPVQGGGGSDTVG